MSQPLSRMKTYGSQRQRHSDKKRKSSAAQFPRPVWSLKRRLLPKQVVLHPLLQSLYLGHSVNPMHLHWKALFYRSEHRVVPKKRVTSRRTRFLRQDPCPLGPNCILQDV